MLPFKLPIGTVAVYGVGASISNNLFSRDQNEFIKFGTVSESYNQNGRANVGQVVMFDIRDAKTIFYIDRDYSILPEDKIGGVEQPPL